MTIDRRRHPPAMPEGFTALAANYRYADESTVFAVRREAGGVWVGQVNYRADGAISWVDIYGAREITEAELGAMVVASWARRRLEGTA